MSYIQSNPIEFLGIIKAPFLTDKRGCNGGSIAVGVEQILTPSRDVHLALAVSQVYTALLLQPFERLLLAPLGPPLEPVPFRTERRELLDLREEDVPLGNGVGVMFHSRPNEIPHVKELPQRQPVQRDFLKVLEVVHQRLSVFA